MKKGSSDWLTAIGVTFIIFMIMFSVMVIAFHNLTHDGYAPLWAGVFIGGTIGLTREIVLRHRAKKAMELKRSLKNE